jgi:hypothetical protein
VHYYFCMVLFSNQELKENKNLHLKGETFHMLCHFTRFNWNKQTLFFKNNHNWLFCFCKFCLCCVFFKYQKCVVDFGISVCLYYIIWKVREWGKRKLFDVILFIMHFWLAIFLFKLKVWPFVWKCVYFWKERKRGEFRSGRFNFSWIWRLKCGGICDFWFLEENKGKCKERGCSFVDFGVLDWILFPNLKCSVDFKFLYV